MTIRLGMGRFHLGASLFVLALAVQPALAEGTTGDAPSARIKSDRTDTVLAPDGRIVRTRHSEILAVNDAAAMELGQLQLTYDAALSDFEIVEAHTLKKDGTRVPLDPATVFDQLAPAGKGTAMVTEFHSKTLVFPQFAAGDTAVYTVRETMREPLLPGQYWDVRLFPHALALDEVKDSLTAPSSMALHIENHGVDFTKTAEGGKTVYRWHYAAPNPHGDVADGVVNLASENYYAVSTFADYGALGRSWWQASQASLAPAPQIRALADQITAGVSDRRQIARKLYEWVSSHIRYVAVELGRGSIIPHPAQSVLANGYGDCKDHVALLGALLKAKGIDSDGVLINAGRDYMLTGAPTLTGLDHIITYIPEFDTYLDSTAAIAPFGTLPFAEYGKPVVFAGTSGARRGTIPLVAPGTASIRTVAVLNLSKDGKLSGKTATTGSGPFELSLRGFALAVQSAGSQAAAHNLLVALGYGENAVGNVGAPPPLTPSTDYTVVGQFQSPGWSELAQGRSAFLMPGGLRITGPAGDGLMGPLGENKLPASASYPCYSAHASEDLSLTVPAGMHPIAMPAGVHVQGPNVRFEAQWSFNGTVLHVRRDFESRLNQALCTPAIRTANAAAIAQIRASYYTPLALTSGAPAISQAAPQPGAPALRLADAPMAWREPSLGAASLKEVIGQSRKPAEQLAGLPFETHLLAAALGEAGTAAEAMRGERLSELVAVTRPQAAGLRAKAERLLMQKSYDAALSAFDAAVAANPADANAYVGRAIAKRMTHHYAPALRDVEHAVALGDTDALKRFQEGIGGH